MIIYSVVLLIYIIIYSIILLIYVIINYEYK